MPLRILALLAFVLLASAGSARAQNVASWPGRDKWDAYYSQQDHPNSRYRDWNPPQYWGSYRGEGYGPYFDRWERRRDLAAARRLHVGESIEDWQDVQRAREEQLYEQYRDQYRSSPYYQGWSQPYNPEPSVPAPSQYYYERGVYRSYP